MRERAIDYQSINQKADRGFQLEAPSLERLYIDSALAMTDQQVKLTTIQGGERFEVLVESNTREELLALWLNEILQLFENNKFLPRQIYFSQFNGTKIKATLMGETYNPIKHGHITKLKSILPENLKLGTLNQGDNIFFAQVLLDK
ncbi:MAG: archease [Proteobacteria bacterium]|nr:archease [Pseudomonadota bacterium]